jgi:hypothetical protein
MARVQGPDDELAADVDLHVLVLPVALGTEHLGRLVRVQQLGRGGIGDVIGAEAVPPRGQQDLPAGDRVELALHDIRRVRHTADVLERIRDRSTRRGVGSQSGGAEAQRPHQHRARH